MRKFLVGLLIFFALSLCALISLQWVRETQLRSRLQKTMDELHAKSEEAQTLQGVVKRTEAEVLRLDNLKKEMTETIKTNRQEITNLRRDVEKATTDIERHLKQIDVYKEALTTANQNIKKQNEDIKKQNEQLKQLADERNEAVGKFNTLAKDYNDLVNRWNKLQEDLAKAESPGTGKK